MPEFFHRLVMEAVGAGVKENPGQYPVPEAVVEAFEPLKFVHDVLWDPALPASGQDLKRSGEEAKYALLFKATLERAKRFRVGGGLRRPLHGGACWHKQQRANEFIALLRGVII